MSRFFQKILSKLDPPDGIDKLLKNWGFKGANQNTPRSDVKVPYNPNYKPATTGGGGTSKGRQLANAAIEDLKKWGNGGIQEGDKRTLSNLTDYWKGTSPGYNWNVDTPWSAVFISTQVKKAGITNFKKSQLHSTYIRDAIANKDNPGAPFRGLKPTDPGAKLAIGDIVGTSRGGAVTKDYYNYKKDYPSHTDIVTGFRNYNGRNYAEVVGGNVSTPQAPKGTVGMKLIPLTKEGKIDVIESQKTGGFVVGSDNKIYPGKPKNYFVVMKLQQ